jgi:hypothetical protein
VVLTTVEFDIPKAEADLIKRASQPGGLPKHFFRAPALPKATADRRPSSRTPTRPAPPTWQRLRDIEKKVKSGEIKVPEESTGPTPIGQQGSGSTSDVKGLGCNPQ